MKFVPQGLGLALIGAGLVAVPSALSSTATAAAAPDQIQQLRSAAHGTVSVAREGATGAVSSVRAGGAGADLLPTVAATDTSGAAAKADAYLTRFGTAFGAPRQQLERTATTATGYGWTVHYSQQYQGVPVFAGELLANLDAQGDLTSVSGYVVPDLHLDVTPRLSRADAAAKAVRLVTASPSGRTERLSAAEADGLHVATAGRYVYRMGAIQGVPGKNLLAWVVEVTNGKQVRETVVLDAATGKPVNRYSMIDNALERTLIEAYDGEQDPAEVWHEGDDFPAALDADQQSEILTTSESYWMYKNTFGRDSYDGLGAPMTTVNNDPSISCPNANWNGTTTNYCDGVSSDDTVAHEWGHAYTEYTSGLLYQYQPGAMNEAYSDIWGETVDILNDRFNEEPDTHRTDGTCSAYTRGEISMTINAPSDLAGECDAVAASFGPVFDKTGVTTDIVVGADAADDAGPTTTDGCSRLTNADAVAGEFVYVDRGGCTPGTKAGNAEAAGAAGIVIGNNSDTALYSASGNADIYGLMVDQATGARIKAATETVNATIVDSDTAAKDDSYRWLSGEADPAFGGAIRDMWNPTCYGDPGKVSDEEYYCDTDDSGGVHSNSGVVNHTFALLVDGGTYNGVTVPAIGLDKAANLFWRTQTSYLTPTSGFPELADGLASSCADLTGQAINKVTLGDPTRADEADGAAVPELADPITAADCAAVAAVATATQLRVEPVQCNFGPLLAQGRVSCGEGLTSVATYTEDFEDGLAGWTQDEELSAGWNDTEENGIGHGFAWTTTTSLPKVTTLPGGTGTHTGSVAFATDPTDGSCAGDADDISSRNGLISPAIAVPAGFAPRLSFDHYVATEAGYDGGNVKYKVAGAGDDTWQVVPTSAYLLNAPGAELSTVAEGNTDPMAGEPAYTGTDGGQVTGSWGTSYINLQKLAKPGEQLQFRFDIGRDGCGGVDGWYVDNVTVTVCEVAPTTPPATPPASSPAAAAVRSTLKVNAPGSVLKKRSFDAKVKVRASGPAATGAVQISFHGRVLGRGVLTNGKVTIVIDTGSLKVGRRKLKASYAGSTSVLAGSDAFTVRILPRR